MARCLVVGASVPERDVDDVTQEVLCMLAFRPKPRLAPARSGRRTRKQARAARIAAATRIQLVQHARRQARLRIGDRLGAELLSARFTPSAEDLALAFAPIATLRRALAKLARTKPALSTALDLSADGASIAVVAARLGIPWGTAYTRVRQARGMVRAFFGRESASAAFRGTGGIGMSTGRSRLREGLRRAWRRRGP